MFGAVAVAGTRTRVTGRVVQVETGVIQKGAKAYSDKPGADGVAEAAAGVIGNLPMTCTRVRGTVN